MRVLKTPRGTIVARTGNDSESIFDPVPVLGSANALSFAATWLERRPTRSLLGFHHVKSFDEFREACSRSAGCAYSLIYADSSTVGWVLAAEVPRRRSGFGSLPLPGWLEETGWQDIAGSSELPWSRNPQEGFVCCANNKPVADGDAGVFLGHDFLDGYRQRRIAEQLASRDDWTLDGMAKLQVDVQSLPFADVRDTVLALSGRNEDERRALAILKDWDGVMGSDSIGASVYGMFVAALNRRVCETQAPNSYHFASGKGVMKLIPGTCFNSRRAGFTTRLIREQPPGYFEAWPPVLLDALGSAVQMLREKFGTTEAAWAWGEIRPLTLKHRFGDKKPLDQVFNVGPLPGYGDSTTVNQAGFEFWEPLRPSTVLAHLRSVMEVGNWGASRFVVLGGQSGNPLSEHYADLVPLYLRGEGVPVHWEDEAVRREAVATITLSPGMTTQPVRTETL